MGETGAAEAVFDGIGNTLSDCATDEALWNAPPFSINQRETGFLAIPPLGDEQTTIRYRLTDDTHDLRVSAIRVGNRIAVVEMLGPYPVATTTADFNAIVRAAARRMAG